jgi:hypothetical protein
MGTGRRWKILRTTKICGIRHHATRGTRYRMDQASRSPEARPDAAVDHRSRLGLVLEPSIYVDLCRCVPAVIFAGRSCQHCTKDTIAPSSSSTLVSSLEQAVRLLFVPSFFCRGLRKPGSYRACRSFSSLFRRHVNSHLYAITVAISNHLTFCRIQRNAGKKERLVIPV